MYTVSELYKQKIREQDRLSKIKGTLTLKNGTSYNLDESCFKLSSITIDNQCVDGDEINLGSVYAGQLQCELLTDIDRFKLYNAVIELKFSLMVDYIRDKWEDVPLGKFTITEATKNYNITKITGLDNMLKFEKKLPKKFEFYGSLYGLLVKICTACKMQLGTPKADIEKMPNGNISDIYIGANHKSMTYRDLISNVAQVLCGFATIDRHGKLVIRRFGTVSVDTITDRLRNSVDVADKTIQYQQVICESKGEELVYNDTLEEDVLTIDLGENDLMQFGELADRKARLKNIGDCITKLQYVPCDLDYVGNPALDLGDRLTLVGGQLNDSLIEVVLTKSNWSFRNKHKISSAGKSLIMTKVLTKADKTANDYGMNSNTTSNFLVCENKELFTITSSKQELHYLIFQAEEQCIVLMRTIVCVNSTAECNVTFNYEINGTLINDFIPTQKLNIGNNIINLIYPISKENIKKDGDNNVVRLYVQSDGISIPIQPLYSKTILNGNAIIQDVTPEYEEPDYGDFDPFNPDYDPYFDPDLPNYDFDYPVCPYDPEYETCPEDWNSPDCPFNDGFNTGDICPYNGGGSGDTYDPNNYGAGQDINIELYTDVQDGFMFQEGHTIWVAQHIPSSSNFATPHTAMQVGKNSIISVNEWDKIYIPSIVSTWMDDMSGSDMSGSWYGDGDLLVDVLGSRNQIGFTFLVEFEITRANGTKVTQYAPITVFSVGNPTLADYDHVIVPDPEGIVNYSNFVNPRMSMFNTRAMGYIPSSGNLQEWVVPKLGVDYNVSRLENDRTLGNLSEGDTWVCKGVTKAVVQCIAEYQYDWYFGTFSPTTNLTVTKYDYLG